MRALIAASSSEQMKTSLPMRSSQAPMSAANVSKAFALTIKPTGGNARSTFISSPLCVDITLSRFTTKERQC